MRVRIPRLEQRTGGLAARSVRNPYPPGLLDSARLLLHVTPRRGPELTLVFPVELGNAFVADFDGRAARVFPFDQHEPLGLIKPQMFLELQGAHACYLSEMPVECRWRHVRLPGQFLNMERSCEIFPEPGNGPGYLTGLRARATEKPEAAALASGKEVIVDLAQNHGRENGNSSWVVQQIHEPDKGFKQLCSGPGDNGGLLVRLCLTQSGTAFR